MKGWIGGLDGQCCGLEWARNARILQNHIFTNYYYYWY